MSIILPNWNFIYLSGSGSGSGYCSVVAGSVCGFRIPDSPTSFPGVESGHVSPRIWEIHQMCVRGWVAM